MIPKTQGNEHRVMGTESRYKGTFAGDGDCGDWTEKLSVGQLRLESDQGFRPQRQARR